MEDGYRVISSQFRRYSYAELKKAMENFKEEVGRGGSGAVYKGVLEDEREVAVKRLGDIYQGEEVFWAEVSTIGKIYHMNLVRMWGFCSEDKHRLLIYEYVKNQSPDRHLFSSDFLGWKERFKVAFGTAKGDGDEEERELKRFVREVETKIQCEEESWIEDVADPRMNRKFSENQVATLVRIGISCVEGDQSKRPTMDSVVQALLECEAESEVVRPDKQ
ncbi:hypothetical protein LWI28_004860 [Acer negundo]|uniref:non-specific serine/threonine protein kinase n=1 Tax=Acer negundo TaxID=4023 RepID=A0AAD5I555_ACENE|nr:hypothetical protein LWI28_004860 [Acer negundo]